MILSGAVSIAAQRLVLGTLLLATGGLLAVVLTAVSVREYRQTGEFNYFALMVIVGAIVTNVQSAISSGHLPDTAVLNGIVVIGGVFSLVFGAIFARNFDWSFPESNV